METGVPVDMSTEQSCRLHRAQESRRGGVGKEHWDKRQGSGCDVIGEQRDIEINQCYLHQFYWEVKSLRGREWLRICLAILWPVSYKPAWNVVLQAPGSSHYFTQSSRDHQSKTLTRSGQLTLPRRNWWEKSQAFTWDPNYSLLPCSTLAAESVLPQLYVVSRGITAKKQLEEQRKGETSTKHVSPVMRHCGDTTVIWSFTSFNSPLTPILLRKPNVLLGSLCCT